MMCFDLRNVTGRGRDRNEPNARGGFPQGPSPSGEVPGADIGPSEGVRTREHGAEPHVSRNVEVGLMGFSLLVAFCGIALAHKFYVTNPEISERLAERWAGMHKLLSNKYYVDELYDATAISGTFAAGKALWTVDRNVVDGAVNGTGWFLILFLSA